MPREGERRHSQTEKYDRAGLRDRASGVPARRKALDFRGRDRQQVELEPVSAKLVEARRETVEEAEIRDLGWGDPLQILDGISVSVLELDPARAGAEAIRVDPARNNNVRPISVASAPGRWPETPARK